MSATARNTAATSAALRSVGYRPRRRELDTPSSSLIRSSTIGVISSAGLRVARTTEGTEIEHPYRERLHPLAPGHDAELDPGPGLEIGHAFRQHITVDEDLLALVVGEEAEALLRVEPLHLARGHGVTYRRQIQRQHERHRTRGASRRLDYSAGGSVRHLTSPAAKQDVRQSDLGYLLRRLSAEWRRFGMASKNSETHWDTPGTTVSGTGCPGRGGFVPIR